MAALSGTVEAPSQGVSQASPAIRLPTQASVLEDSLVDIPEGWRKRPPLDYRGKLTMAALDPGASLEVIKDPDDGSRLLLVLNPEAGAVKPYLFTYPGLAPVALTIDAGSQAYLNLHSPTPQQDIGILKAVDTTILTNRKVVTTVEATLNTTRPKEAIIFVKAGAFGKRYAVTVTKTGGSPITFNWSTPDGTDAVDTKYADTAAIAYGLMNASPFVLPGTTYSYDNAHGNNFGHHEGGALLTADGFTWSVRENLIYLTHPTLDFIVVTSDGSAGNNMTAIKDTVALFSDLPRSGFDGFTLKIDPAAKDGTLPGGAYYVSWTGNKDTGTWKEVVGPGSQKGVDLDTMPVKVFKDAGAWHLEPCTWKARTVGNETLCPDPGFVGQKIMDVAYCFNRLAILYSEGMLLAAVDDPFRIYPSTATTGIDSDPVDLVTPGAARAEFFAVLPFNKTFVLFGKAKQAIVNAPAEGPATASNTRLEELTDFTAEDDQAAIPTILKLRPIAGPRSLFYPVLVGPSFYGIQEMPWDRLSNSPISNPLTPHLPRYLPSTIDRAVMLPGAFLALYGASGRSDIWANVRRYADASYDYRPVQNGWFHWNFPLGWTVNGMATFGTLVVFLLSFNSGEAHIATMETAPTAQDPDASATVLTLLDLRMTEALVTSRVYDADADATTITIPRVPVTSLTQMAARAPGGTPFAEGFLATILSRTATTLVVQGNWTAQPFWVGFQYTADWKLSTIYYNSTGDQRPQTSGRLRLRRLKAQLFNTTFIKCTVRGSPGRSQRAYSWPQNVLGAPVSFTGTWYRIPVNAESEKAEIHFLNDSHLPHRLTTIEWIGEYVSGGQRVT